MSNAISIEEIFGNSTGSVYETTVVTHATNGVVGYGRGSVTHVASRSIGPFLRSSTLTTKGNFIPFLFSDRRRSINPPVEGGFGQTSDQLQPFDVDQSDKVGLAVYPTSFRRLGGPNLAYGATLTFLSWGGGRMSIDLDPMGDFLVGVTPESDGVQSMFSLSFSMIERPR